MPGPMIACPSCAAHVLVRDAKCPHCGATVRSGGVVLGRTAGAVLMGLSLAGCPAGDDTEETTTMGGSATTPTSGTPTSASGSTTDDSGSTSFDASSGPVGEAYGTPDTGSFSDTTDSDSTTGGGTDGSSSGSGSGSTGTGGDTGSTGISPDYGVPPTSD